MQHRLIDKEREAGMNEQDARKEKINALDEAYVHAIREKEKQEKELGSLYTQIREGVLRIKAEADTKVSAEARNAAYLIPLADQMRQIKSSLPEKITAENLEDLQNKLHALGEISAAFKVEFDYASEQERQERREALDEKMSMRTGRAKKERAPIPFAAAEPQAPYRSIESDIKEAQKIVEEIPTWDVVTQKLRTKILAMEKEAQTQRKIQKAESRKIEEEIPEEKEEEQRVIPIEETLQEAQAMLEEAQKMLEKSAERHAAEALFAQEAEERNTKATQEVETIQAALLSKQSEVSLLQKTLAEKVEEEKQAELQFQTHTQNRHYPNGFQTTQTLEQGEQTDAVKTELEKRSTEKQKRKDEKKKEYADKIETKKREVGNIETDFILREETRSNAQEALAKETQTLLQWASTAPEKGKTGYHRIQAGQEIAKQLFVQKNGQLRFDKDTFEKNYEAVFKEIKDKKEEKSEGFLGMGKTALEAGNPLEHLLESMQKTHTALAKIPDTQKEHDKKQFEDAKKITALQRELEEMQALQPAKEQEVDRQIDADIQAEETRMAGEARIEIQENQRLGQNASEARGALDYAKRNVEKAVGEMEHLQERLVDAKQVQIGATQALHEAKVRMRDLKEQVVLKAEDVRVARQDRDVQEEQIANRELRLEEKALAVNAAEDLALAEEARHASPAEGAENVPKEKVPAEPIKQEAEAPQPANPVVDKLIAEKIALSQKSSEKGTAIRNWLSALSLLSGIGGFSVELAIQLGAGGAILPTLPFILLGAPVVLALFLSIEWIRRKITKAPNPEKSTAVPGELVLLSFFSGLGGFLVGFDIAAFGAVATAIPAAPLLLFAIPFTLAFVLTIEWVANKVMEVLNAKIASPVALSPEQGLSLRAEQEQKKTPAPMPAPQQVAPVEPVPPAPAPQQAAPVEPIPPAPAPPQVIRGTYQAAELKPGAAIPRKSGQKKGQKKKEIQIEPWQDMPVEQAGRKPQEPEKEAPKNDAPEAQPDLPRPFQ